MMRWGKKGGRRQRTSGSVFCSGFGGCEKLKYLVPEN